MITTTLKPFVNSALAIATGLLLALPAHSAQNCVPGYWQSPPNSYWDQYNGSFPVQAESTHFQIRWPANKPNLFTREEANRALVFFEQVFNWFTSPPVNWIEPFCDTAVKHKVQIFTDEGYPLTGSGGGDRTQAMWVDAWRIKDGPANKGWSRTALVHEFTHTMQFNSRGMRNTNFGGWFWESHAEFMAHQYPDNDVKVGCTESSAWQPHLYYGNLKFRYCNWQLWSHLKDKYGFAAVNNIWFSTAGQNGQDPLAAFMRTWGWSVSMLGDEIGQYAMKNVNWDYIDGQDGFNRGAAFRAKFGKNSDQRALPTHLRLAKLDPIDIYKRQFVVSKYFAPQRYGYNIVRLIPDAGAGNITINFRGVVQAAMAYGADVSTAGTNQPGTVPNAGSNWRWGVVAIDAFGNSRPSAMQRGTTADLNFALLPGDQEVYLVVAATPDIYQPIASDQRYHTIYRYPYKVQLAGALPDGYQPGYQVETARNYPAGRKHSYGGGWVANTATVAPTAYVGPNAAVLGGTVLGNARIEDYAAVWGGTVTDAAVVGGLTQLCGNNTVAGFAQVRSTLVCGFGDNIITGTAKLFGDLEVGLGKTPVTAGAFSGTLLPFMLNSPSFGSTKTQEPVEVTVPTPPGWPAIIPPPPVVIPPSLTPPYGSVKCANEGGICTLPVGRTATVWFGARTSYKVLVGRSGNVACNTATFGGNPIWWSAKACYYLSN